MYDDNGNTLNSHISDVLLLYYVILLNGLVI